MENKRDKRNKFCFGLGTIGRDMFYTFESMFLIVYLSEVKDLDDRTMLLMTGVLMGLRIFDAFNDPIMGLIVDNTRTRWGKFKPGMLVGAIGMTIFLILMFTDLGISGALYVALFAIFYLAWDVFYGINDISYWSMLPSLTTDQKERERMGAFARICANVGLFTVVVAVLPVTGLLGDVFGSPKTGWLVFALIVSVIMLGFMSFTLFGVKENREQFKQEENTSFLEMFRVIARNDQLIWVAISMGLFMIGYMTTTSFGTYFFKYAYGNENTYSIFALVLGISQMFAMIVFPLFRKKYTRKKIFTAAIIMIAVGYIGFFISPMNMLPIGICGVLIFIGEAFIQILMLMFLADCIEYGQWKNGKRNESITFSIQPFINKIGGAVASGIVGLTLVISGINRAEKVVDVADSGISMMKVAMMILPLVLIAISYLINIKKFKIDEVFHKQILDELTARGDIGGDSK